MRSYDACSRLGAFCYAAASYRDVEAAQAEVDVFECPSVAEPMFQGVGEPEFMVEADCDLEVELVSVCEPVLDSVPKASGSRSGDRGCSTGSVPCGACGSKSAVRECNACLKPGCVYTGCVCAGRVSKVVNAAAVSEPDGVCESRVGTCCVCGAACTPCSCAVLCCSCALLCRRNCSMRSYDAGSRLGAFCYAAVSQSDKKPGLCALLCFRGDSVRSEYDACSRLGAFCYAAASY